MSVIPMILKKLIVPVSLLVMLLLNADFLLAQSTISSDDLFLQARKAAFDQKDYPKAISLCKQALSQSPGYTDIQVFLGRLFFWSNKEDSARIMLARAVEQQPDHEDAAVAAASIAYFTNRNEESLKYCNGGLQYHPHSADLLLQKAKTLTAMREYKTAVRITDSVLKLDPKNADARALASRIRDYSASNKIGISYDYTHFAKQFSDPWHLVSLDYSRQTKLGSVIGRVNYGSRFAESGVQFEVDAYPTIAKNFYAYVNVGYSPDLPIFAKWRGGFSLYANLPKGFEADAGFRYLNFDNDTWIYTGSIGKYYKDFWFNLQAYITPDDERISHSYAFTTRYYLGGADDFLHLSIGTGVSPDDRAQSIQLNSNYKLKTHRISGGYRFSHKKLNVFLINAGYANVEYLPKTKDDQITVGVGYQRRF